MCHDLSMFFRKDDPATVTVTLTAFEMQAVAGGCMTLAMHYAGNEPAQDTLMECSRKAFEALHQLTAERVQEHLAADALRQVKHGLD